MSRTLRAYQVVATLVGLNLIFTIDQVHGLLFMVLLVLIAMLHSRHHWKPGFTISTMLLATIPLVTFWAERRTTHAVLARSGTPDEG